MTFLRWLYRKINGYCPKHQQVHEILNPGTMGGEEAECRECREEADREPRA